MHCQNYAPCPRNSWFFVFLLCWEREKAQAACKCGKPAKEERDKNTEEEDRAVDITDSPEPHEVTVAREEISLLLAEQHKTMALRVRRWRCPYGHKSDLRPADARGQDGSSIIQRGSCGLGLAQGKPCGHLYCSWTPKYFGLLKEAAWEHRCLHPASLLAASRISKIILVDVTLISVWRTQQRIARMPLLSPAAELPWQPPIYLSSDRAGAAVSKCQGKSFPDGGGFPQTNHQRGSAGGAKAPLQSP